MLRANKSSRKHSELGLRPAMPKPHVLLVRRAAARWLRRFRYETMTELTRERINQLKNGLRDDTTPDQEGTATPSPEHQKRPTTNAATETTAEPSSSNASPDQEDNANKRCDCPPSPDGKIAFLSSDSEEDSFGDRLQIIDLIDKKSGKKLQRSDEAAMPVYWN